MFKEDLSKIEDIYIYNYFNISHYHMIFDNMKLFYFLSKKLNTNKKHNIFVSNTIPENLVNNYFNHFKLNFNVIPDISIYSDKILSHLKEKIYYIQNNILYINGIYIKRTFKDEESLKDFFLYMRSFINFNNTEYKNKKIIINRENTRRLDPYTIDDFIQKGYEEVFFERMKIQDQIDIFANCSEIVAVHGAALVNLIFSKNNLKITEIGINYNDSCFSSLVNFLKIVNLEIDYKYLNTNNKNGKMIKEFYFDVKRLEYDL